MNVLVINAGSSSLKFEVFSNESVTLKGAIKEIGHTQSVVVFESQNQKKEVQRACKNHEEAMHILIDILLQCDVHDIQAVGHRVVHGGSVFVKPVQISNGILHKLELLNSLAPLHNPANIIGIRSAMALFDHVPHVAVFDTAFHSTMPEHVTVIPVPEEFRHDGLLRKYGFHGTSHEYIFQKVSKLHVPHARVISAHIGNGISVCAIKDGKSVNSSMGFTPLPGPVMGTRTGDIDFGAALFLHQHDNLSMDELSSLFNHQGGLQGICGMSDIKRIHEAAPTTPVAKLALDRLTSDIARIIAGYTADLGGVDVLSFAGGAGEGAPWLRSMICSKLEHLGVSLDEQKNNGNDEGIISPFGSSVHVVMIHTDEERMIARKVKEILHH